MNGGAPAPGAIVLYWSGGALALGRIVAEEKQRWRLARVDGRDERVTAARIALIVEGAHGDVGAGVDELRRLETTMRDAAGAVDVSLLWELTRETGGGVDAGIDLDVLGPLAVDHESPGVARAATLIAIREERLHFERKGERWLPRDAESVAALTAERQLVERRERESGELNLALARIARGETAELPDSEASRRTLAALRRVACEDAELPQAERAAVLAALELTGADPRSPPASAFRLLRALGVYDDDDHNLQPERFGIRTAFPAIVLEHGARRALGGSSSDGRTDLTDRLTFSIDGPRTSEIDDALSVEPAGADGTRLGVHIADPSAFVEPGDPIDEEALHRGLSHYMPDLRIPMLPPHVSHDAASLVAGAVRPAVSFHVELTAGGEVTSCTIERSIVRCRHRLDQLEADALIADGDDDDPLVGALRTLATSSAARQAARLRDGAIVLQTADVDVWVDERRRPVLEWLPVDSHARRIVTEAMVLAGEMAARRCHDAGVPMLYRRQPLDPRLAGEPPAGPVADPIAMQRIRRGLRRADVSLRPAPHASLGVQLYCQATSPLRRFQDLVCHRQLLAVIEGRRPVYDRQALLEILATTGAAERNARRAEARALEYWRLRWLELRGDATLPAIVLDPDPRPAVRLDALLCTYGCPAVAGLEPGSAVELRVTRIDPRAGLVRFERIE